MTPINDGTIVIYGSNKLRRYNIQTGVEISSAGVRDAMGMAEVKFGEKTVFAVSNYW